MYRILCKALTTACIFIVCKPQAQETALVKFNAENADTLKSKNFSVGLNAMYGFMMANQPKAYYVSNDHSRMIELNVSRQSNGQHSWHAEVNYPRTGIAMIFGGVGSRQYIGNVFAIYPYIHFPIVRTNHWETSFRLGTGLGWVEKPYDKNDNPKNLIIGTHLNATISLRLESEYRLSRHLSMNAGLHFTHLSNGTYRLPNLGLNLPGISAGVRYHPTEQKIKSPAVVEAQNKKLRYAVHLSGAFKQTYPLETKPGMIITIQGEVTRNFLKSSRYGAGLVIANDGSLGTEVAYADTYIFDRSAPQWQVAAYATYHHRIGRLSIPLQFGTYIYNRYKIDPLFQVIGIRYQINRHWIAGIHLKTHFGNADYIYCGVGYEF